jgi:hypothetical protein
MFLKLRQKVFWWLEEAAKQKYADYPVEKATKPYTANIATLGASPNPDSLNGRPMEFRVFPGQGGVAISYNRFDERKGDYTSCLHIVPDSIDDADAVAKAISEIITLQAIRG